MPPRNNPHPNSVRMFNCTLCDKGYSRQLEYENHLRSYDHNHRERLANMKKLTANEGEGSAKPKQGADMRSIDVQNANKMVGVGSRFTKIGGGAAAGAAGSRFKKVGVAVGTEAGQNEATQAKKEENSAKANVQVPEPVVPTAAMPGPQTDNKEEDVIMADEPVGEIITWEQYDFTKPTGCDHNCPGVKTEGIWSGKWLLVDSD
ncbi:uncharacterized protein yc1106_01309 [Curvularia clavata]|uniref:C2H2-type domain-containing protein n=1 Tax=Curvularia clavata TaxID=95742 RepID=A0A9Q9DPD2_CURCL|nr:uncharacterized protein yc1106_01309 [Curvularia clavata]